MVKFVIGNVLKISTVFHKIKEIEPLFYQFTNDGTAFTANTTARSDITQLQPEDDELYWIEFVGVEGIVRVQLQYPSGRPRMTPHGLQQFLHYDHMSVGKPYPFQFVIKPSYFPTLNVNNPHATADMYGCVWFYGLKIKFRKVSAEIAASSPVIELTDYAE
jgi:hypothetical protein